MSAREGRSNSPNTNHLKLLGWVEKVKKLCQPDEVHWCDGSQEEYDTLCGDLVHKGTFTRLKESKNRGPNCFLARSDPADVARVESKTFICSALKEDAGPTNNWADPTEMKENLENLFAGCMRGRTMFVIPFCMGPINSKFSKFGVEITDSAYVVVNMRIMTRMGTQALEKLGEDAFFLPCLHSVGKPLSPDEKDVAWPCDPDNTVIAHFPDEPSVWSFGSGYGGNALLGKKCFALRIASVMGKKEGWLAEHCLILSLTSPEGKKYYVGAAFPSACGKTNLAMLVPTIPGWTVRCVGDDIAWLHVGDDGRLYAINPEAGFFGVAPGTSDLSNRSAMVTINRNSIFTNVALTPEGDVWWEGMTKQTPDNLIDWTGQPWTPGCGRKAAHPNSRYTTPASQCPIIDSEWQNPNGVPICAIIFGGRREKLVPLVTEAFIWEHGVFMGSIISSEQTAAAEGKLGAVRRDPFAMLPFCGYNMADYFNHWFNFRKSLGYLSPKIFYVNWFKKGDDGKFLWPGFGENSRVLKWICERVDGVGKARSTAIGYVPSHDALDLGGLDISPATLHNILHVDEEEWLQEIPGIREFYDKFGDRVPAGLRFHLDNLEARLKQAQAAPTGNKKLISWVQEMKKLCKPEKVHWCTGTDEEYNELCDGLVLKGTFTALNPELRPNSFVSRTDPRDTSRADADTFMCTNTQEEVGQTNNWADPQTTKEKVNKLFDGSMKGRTMYIIPFCMGPLGSPYSKYGVEITDSPYVVVNMRFMTRIGTKVLNLMGEDKFFLPCLHSVGAPLESGKSDVSWPCNPENRIIAHFPEDPSVYSYGSGFGVNSLLGKLSYGLRLGSIIGKKEGWFAERCAILAVTSPEGKKMYVAASLPLGCGKTNFAMLIPTIPGWTVRCVGDDIAWLHIGDDGKLYAINPEAGFFDVAPGTSYLSNRSAMVALSKNCIFTNVALTPEGDVWWEGMTRQPPSQLTDWTGQPWTPGCGRNAAHPNSRYTTPATDSPVLDPEWENPNGVPISAIIFGGRRTSTLPLVAEAFTWEHGVLMGASISTEKVVDSKVEVNYEPFGMYPLNGYNMSDYFSHWLEMRARLGYNCPKIFLVNWFRRDSEGKFLWPGFDENSRILKWIFQRATNGSTDYGKTPIGFVPSPQSLDLRGLDISEADIKELLKVDTAEWLTETQSLEKFLNSFSRCPEGLKQELEALKSRLGDNGRK